MLGVYTKRTPHLVYTPSMSVDVHASLIYGVVLEPDSLVLKNGIQFNILGLILTTCGAEETQQDILGISSTYLNTSFPPYAHFDPQKLVTEPHWAPFLKDTCAKLRLTWATEPGWLLFHCNL